MALRYCDFSLCLSYGAFAGGMAISPGPGRAAAAEGVEGGGQIALPIALSL
jgi:hypothetical protein